LKKIIAEFLEKKEELRGKFRDFRVMSFL